MGARMVWFRAPGIEVGWVHLLFPFLWTSDYVCVVDVDLLELVITTWKGATSGKLVRSLRRCVEFWGLALLQAAL